MYVILVLIIGLNLNQMISRIVAYQSGKLTGTATELKLGDMYLS